MRRTFPLFCIGLFGCLGEPAAPEAITSSASALSCDVDAEKVLLLRDPKIVDSPEARGDGPFSIAHLLGQIVPEGKAPESLLPLSVLADPTCPPEERSCDLGMPAPVTKIADAPIRLVAIVNRLDLASDENPVGELRFVYQLFYDTVPFSSRKAGKDPRLAKFLNFEFDLSVVRDEAGQPIPRATWASWFQALGGLSLGDPAYLSALEELTSKVVRRGAAPLRPQGSALRALRTSTEQWYPAKDIWELRSLSLTADDDPLVLKGFAVPGQFVSTGLDKTPPDYLNSWWNAPAYKPNEPGSLISFLVDHEADILKGHFDFPRPKIGQSISTDPIFRAHVVETMNGSGNWLSSSTMYSHNKLPEGFTKERWDTLTTAFSKQTCNGCHGSQTKTSGNHFETRAEGTAAPISSFLKDVELPRRQGVMKELLGCTVP